MDLQAALILRETDPSSVYLQQPLIALKGLVPMLSLLLLRHASCYAEQQWSFACQRMVHTV